MSPSSYANSRQRRTFVRPIPFHRRLLTLLVKFSTKSNLSFILFILFLLYWLNKSSTPATRRTNIPVRRNGTDLVPTGVEFAPTQIRSPAAVITFQRGTVQELHTLKRSRRTGVLKQSYTRVWNEGSIVSIQLPTGGALRYTDDVGRARVMRSSTTCEDRRVECDGIVEGTLELDVMNALQEMRSSELSKYMVFKRPSPQHYENDSVTLVTQFTLSRLERFERTLKEWNGPISITIYLTDASDIDHLKTYLESNPTIFDDLALTIVKPDYSLDEASLITRLRYPINRLRNLALDLAPTLYVLVTDADFFPSPQMHHLLQTRGVPLIRSSTISTHRTPTLLRTAIVISAFVLSSAYDGPSPLNTTHLSTLFDAHHITLTDPNAGHGPSLPSLLFHTSPTSTLPSSPFHIQPEAYSYSTCYEPQWEPYYLLHRPSHPRYDERFTDQGGDKQSHTAELNARGYEFKVLRGVWFMHPRKGGIGSKEREWEEWPSARLVDGPTTGGVVGGAGNVEKREEVGEEKKKDEAHFSNAQTDRKRFRYFEDYIPELEAKYGWNWRWSRGCSALVVGGRSFGRARAGTIFGM